MTPFDILRAHASRQQIRPEDCASETPLPIEDGDRVGVVLWNLGGPAGQDDVEPFLYRFLMDPSVFDVPVGGRPRRWLARSVAYLRARTLRGRYEMIGGGSPVPRLAREQACALQDHLQTQYGDPMGVDFRTYPAMRYGRPFPEEVAAQMEADSIDKVVLLPSYPQYSAATTGSALAYWQALKAAGERPRWPTTVVTEFAANPKYVQAVSERVDEALQRFPRALRDDATLVFSAHDAAFRPVPDRADPYCCHAHSTVNQVMRRPERDESFQVAFQSMIGPDHWVPSPTSGTVTTLAEKGHRVVLVVPFTFVTDHINTLYDLDVEVREAAEARGVDHFEVTAGLNTHPLFVEALGEATVAQLDVPVDVNQLRHGGDGCTQSYPLSPISQLPRHDQRSGPAQCSRCDRTTGARRWTRPERSTPPGPPSDRPATPPAERTSASEGSRSRTDS